eukprot:s221_g15.t1
MGSEPYSSRFEHEIRVYDSLRSEISLLLRNALFNAGELVNEWRVLTRWAESLDSFVTLHQASVPGFTLSGMEASIQPASVNPGAFHILNVTVTPRNDRLWGKGLPTPSAVLRVPQVWELQCTAAQCWEGATNSSNWKVMGAEGNL